MGNESSSDSIVRLESAIMTDCARGMAFSSVSDSVRKNLYGDGDGERVADGGAGDLDAVRVGMRNGVRDAVREGTARLAVAVLDRRGGVLDAVLVGIARVTLADRVYERECVAVRVEVEVSVAAFGCFGVLEGRGVRVADAVEVRVGFFASARGPSTSSTTSSAASTAPVAGNARPRRARTASATFESTAAMPWGCCVSVEAESTVSTATTAGQAISANKIAITTKTEAERIPSALRQTDMACSRGW